MAVSTRAPKILFVHPDPSDHVTSFIKQDALFLQQWYAIEELSLHPFKHILLDPIRNPSVWQAVARNDLVFGWFGWCAAVVVIASILKKPALLVGGGADVVSLPEIGYGLNRKAKWRLYLWTLGFRLAQKVLLFSESSRQELLKLLGIQANKVQTLYLGIDSNYFEPNGIKKQQALTISYINENNLRRKGLQTFLEAAQLVPNISFRLGGKIEQASSVEKIKSMASPNVNFLGYLDERQLLAEYQRAKVYTQLSLHEGFGVALAEAMACECIPVVTNRGSIPEVVGDTGVYVPVEDPLATSEAIQQVMFSHDSIKGQCARQRIVEVFPMSKRADGLKAAVEAVIS